MLVIVVDLTHHFNLKYTAYYYYYGIHWNLKGHFLAPFIPLKHIVWLTEPSRLCVEKFKWNITNRSLTWFGWSFQQNSQNMIIQLLFKVENNLVNPSHCVYLMSDYNFKVYISYWLMNQDFLYVHYIDIGWGISKNETSKKM